MPDKQNMIADIVGWGVSDALYGAIREKVEGIVTKKMKQAIAATPSIDKAIAKYVDVKVDETMQELKADTQE